MSLVMTSCLAKRLRDEIRQQPLYDCEIRRIVGLGRWYIAEASTDMKERGFTDLFTLTIDGTAYRVSVPTPEGE